MYFTPNIIAETSIGFSTYTLHDKMFQRRAVLCLGEINAELADSIILQLFHLGMESKEEITLYIHSPGGEVNSGMAIYDTIQYIKCDVSTICIGMAASMAAFLLASGTKGKRMALPYSNIMIHQPLAYGLGGQATDILIHAENITKTKQTMNTLLAEMTGKTVEEVTKDTDRDNYMTAQEAKEYGLIDEVIHKKK